MARSLKSATRWLLAGVIWTAVTSGVAVSYKYILAGPAKPTDGPGQRAAVVPPKKPATAPSDKTTVAIEPATQVAIGHTGTDPVPTKPATQVAIGHTGTDPVATKPATQVAIGHTGTDPVATKPATQVAMGHTGTDPVATKPAIQVATGHTGTDPVTTKPATQVATVTSGREPTKPATQVAPPAAAKWEFVNRDDVPSEVKLTRQNSLSSFGGTDNIPRIAKALKENPDYFAMLTVRFTKDEAKDAIAIRTDAVRKGLIGAGILESRILTSQPVNSDDDPSAIYKVTCALVQKAK